MNSINIYTAAEKISHLRKKTIALPLFPNRTRVVYNTPNAACIAKTVTRKNGTVITGLWKFGSGENFKKLSRFLVRETSSKGTITHTRDYLTNEKIITVQTPDFEATLRSENLKKGLDLKAMGFSKNDLLIIKHVKKLINIIRKGEIV